MLETNVFPELPSEPHIHIPKASLIMRGANHSSNLYQDILILKKINKAKFPVYLVRCKSHDKQYAMKTFPLLDKPGFINKYFQNEIRFSSFCHPNIIKTIHFEHSKQFECQDAFRNAAFTLMEYAPYGDFLSLVRQYKHHFNDKLIRTYFRQLIEGVEYIHNRGAAHLDIKLENLLLAEDFTLKIADFDLSAFVEDSGTLAKGTKYYRAPEIIEAEYKASPSADIYSAGTVLFVLKSGGFFPHFEDAQYRGKNLFDLLNNDNHEFWRVHRQLQNRDLFFFEEDFKELINSMMKLKPEDRATIREIKRSKWFNGPIYSQQELENYFQSSLEI